MPSITQIQSKRRKENNICSHTQCGVNQRYMYGRDRKGRKRKEGKIAQCSFHLRQYSNCDDDEDEEE
jgi:hypothetical protein